MSASCKDRPQHRAPPRQSTATAAASKDVVDQARTFYQSRPPYQRPSPPTEVPDGLPDLRAETCGSCHQAIFEEWKISTHHRAWTDDAQFQAELAKSRGADDDIGWMCVSCHTPTIRQLPRLVTGLKGGDIGDPFYVQNPVFDPKLQDDAITCATCHVDDGVVYGPYGDTRAPHPTGKARTLRSEKVCTQCHQAQAEWPKRNLGCYFSTGDEWAASTYAATDQTCQSCHMPEVTRKLAAGFDRPERKTRRHWFGGSLIPKHPDFADQVGPLRKVYGAGIDITVLDAPDDAEPSEDRAPNFSDRTTTCDSTGPCRRLWVRLTNEHAGHNFPTGDPERHADIHVTVKGPDGQVLGRVQDRIASRYQWWPELKKLYDNRIPPGGRHDILVEVPTDRPLKVTVVGHKYRMYKDAFDHHELGGKYVRGRKFHESRWSVGPDGRPSLDVISDDWGRRKHLRHDSPPLAGP